MKFDSAFIRVCYLNPVLLGIKEEYGIEIHHLGIPKALIDEPMALLPFSQVCLWLDKIELLSQDPAYMVKIAQYLNFSSLNIPGVDFLSTPDLAMCVRRINYGIASFQSGASYYVIQSGKFLKWCYRNPYASQRNKSHDSLRVAIMIFNAVQYFKGTGYRPIKIRLSGPATCQTAVNALFDCPISWNAPQTEIWLEAESLIQSDIIAKYNDEKVTMPRSLFEKYLNMPQPHDSPKVLFEMINYTRFYGLPKVDKVAALLDMNRQQLQRRLHDSGFSFSSMCSYILSNQAVKYMLIGKSVEQISQLLGYTNKQSFSRAFKRLRKCTPQQYLAKITQG